MNLGVILLLLIIYVITMIVPYFGTSIIHFWDPKAGWLQLQFGVLHIPSVIYIGGSFAILMLVVVKRKDIKVQEKIKDEMIEAIEKLDIHKIDFEELFKTPNRFIKDILGIIRHGGIEEDIELSIKKHTADLITAYQNLMSQYNYVAVILPMLGMLGTITGLLQMFSIADGVDNIAQKMAGLSVALATTLYATLLVIMCVKPAYKKIEDKLIDLDNVENKLIINSKLFFHNVDLNRLIEESSKEAEEENDEKED